MKQMPPLPPPHRPDSIPAGPDGPLPALQDWSNAASLDPHSDTSDLSWPQTPSQPRAGWDPEEHPVGQKTQKH